MARNLRHIEVFLTVAQYLHFTKAAHRLNIAQPAISRAIRSLESELGVALFRRNTRKVELTQAGRLFQSESRAALDTLDRAERSARAAGAGDAGDLRIGYMDFALEGVLPEILKAFRTRHPGVSIMPKWSGTEEIQDDLLGGGLDVGFVMGPIEHVGLDARSVQEDRLVAVLPDTHPLAGSSEVALGQLDGVPLVMGRWDVWAPFRRLVEQLCRVAGFTPNVVQEAETTESIFAFVASGMGLTIHVERASRIFRRGVVALPLADVGTVVTTDIAWRAGDDSPLVRRFVALTRELTGRR